MVGTRPSSANTDGPSGLGPLPSKGGKGTVPVCWGCMLIRQMVWGSLKFETWERESLSVGLRSGNSEVCPKMTVCWMDLALGFAVGALFVREEADLGRSRGPGGWGLTRTSRDPESSLPRCQGFTPPGSTDDLAEWELFVPAT